MPALRAKEESRKGKVLCPQVRKGEMLCPRVPVVRFYDNPTTGYHAILYYHARRGEYVFSYEGTLKPYWVDMLNNLAQGLGILSEGGQYSAAKVDAAEAVDYVNRANAQRNQNDRIRFTGHSLGGGLATAAALTVGQQAVVFNAAGVNKWTTNLSLANRLITDYRVQGDILSTLQDSGLLANLMPQSTNATTYWIRGRSASAIDRHTDDILIGMRDFF